MKCCNDVIESNQEVGCCGEDAVASEQREGMIAEAAYFRAERRGFTSGDPVQDWLEAEREINGMLNEGNPNQPAVVHE